MTVPIIDYDPADDARKCYDLAVETKRLRGDTSWPERVPLDHVPVEATKAPNWWLWAVLCACTVFWTAVIAWWAA